MNNTERIAEISTNDLLKAARCIYIACERSIADDIATKLRWAANEISHLTAEYETLEAAYKFLTHAEAALKSEGVE